MTVSCQEAMVEAQALDRMVAPASGPSAATIESLRARLLSERAASKEARQQAHNIAQKVSELQTQLDAEIEYRKKAEAAMKEVLEVLKAKGLSMEQNMANTYLPSVSSARKEAAPIRSSKDGESDQSSGEESSRAHMDNKRRGSSNSQGSVDDAVLTEDSVFEHQEGCISEDSSSEKTQITLEDTSGTDTAEVEKEGINKDEEGSSHEQVVFADPSKAHRKVSLSSSEGGEEGGIQQSSELRSDSVKHAEVEVNTQSSGEAGGDEGGIEQSSELHSDLIKHAARDVNTQSSGEAGSIFTNDSPCLSSSANPAIAHREEGLVATSNEHLSGGQVDARANEAPYPSNVEKRNDMPMPVTENFPGLRSRGVYPHFFFNNGYPYDMPHIYADKVNVSSAEAPFSRGLMDFSNTAYQSRERLSSKVAEFGRYPQAPISDAILSLVDDKNGKLGSILMALHLAKQQLKDEGQASSHMEEKFETPLLTTPFDGKFYAGYYEGVPYQPPYRPWKPEPHDAAPIVHFPMSPTSDHEVSPFERHDGLRRSSSTYMYYMQGYDPYLQPKGELHLGNGITLYTD